MDEKVIQILYFVLAYSRGCYLTYLMTLIVYGEVTNDIDDMGAVVTIALWPIGIPVFMLCASVEFAFKKLDSFHQKLINFGQNLRR